MGNINYIWEDKHINIQTYNSDCIKQMKLMGTDSIDAIVTDPPYELGFMGKKWDSSGIAYNIDVWKEALRVLKPGGHLLAFGGTRTYHRMTCAIEDAGFEIRDCIQWIYGCLSDDTECLTLNGWKKFKELSERDKVMQWNYKTNELSWVLPEKIMSYPAPKTMIHMANRHTDQLLTENHRVYARFRKHSRNCDPKEYTVELAGNMKKHWIKSLPLAGNLNDGIDVYEPYMVGWWCTDAWSRNDMCKAAMFSQSKPATLKKLQDALDTCDCKYSEYIKDRHSKNPRQNDEHTFYVTGKLATYLLDHYPQRKLSWNMMLWSYDSRWKLLDGLLDGDGSRHANDEYAETFWSKTPGRLDFVQALCLSLNIRSYIDYKKGAVYLNRKTNETQCQSKHTLESIDYNGKLVWCLQVPEHAFVVRRNGKAFITGNSGFPKSMDISKAIDKRLGNWRGRQTCVTSQNTCMIGGNYKRTDKGNPITDEAKQWDGWGTCLKPANEILCLAQKPITINDILREYIMEGLKYLQLLASIVEKNFTLNLTLLKEGENFVLKNAGFNIVTQEDLNEKMDILQSVLKTENINLSMMLSWKNILEESYILTNKYTIETKLKMITELRTLNFLQFLLIQNSTTKEKTRRDGEPLNVSIVGNNLKGDFVKLKTILTLFVAENATWKGSAKDYVNSSPICLARKPIAEKTIIDNVLKYSTGGINIDACRISTDELKISKVKGTQGQDGIYGEYGLGGIYTPNKNGRFPSNVILDEVSADMLDKQTGISKSTDNLRNSSHTKVNCYGKYGPHISNGYSDSGGASRFFYCAKASRNERNIGGINNHPTVKPIKLMEYLVKLVTPPNGTVLDPFMGSGTTGIACAKNNINFVGIELQKDYFEIANKRIGANNGNI